MLKTYLKTAARNFLRNKGFLVINICGLSIGMTVTLLILLWVNNELNYDNYHKDADHIYRITNHLEVTKGDVWVWENSPMLYGELAQKQVPEIAAATKLMDGNWTPLIFEHNGNMIKEKEVAYVDPNWFSVFSYKILSGSFSAFSENPYSLVLTKSEAKKYFGVMNPVGKVLRSDSLLYTVCAVVADIPPNSSFKFNIISSIASLMRDPSRASNDKNWGNFSYITFLKLKPEANRKAVEKKITKILRDNKDDKTILSTLVPLKAMHFETGLQNFTFSHINKQVVTVLTIIAMLILLTACINYVNLSTARASMRAKEVCIRKINGAKISQLFLQFMAESVIISLAAIIISLLLVQLTLPFFNQFTENNFSISLADPGMILQVLGTLSIATLLNGVYPAILLTSFNPMNIIRGSSLPSIKDSLFRKTLVVIQFTISVALIASTFIGYLQMKYIQKANSGYNKNQIVKITIPWSAFKDQKRTETPAFLNIIKQSFQNISGVKTISQSNGSIIEFTSSSSGGFDWSGRPRDFNPTVSVLSADATFPKLFNLQLKEGRWYRDHDKADEKSFVLNETAASELSIHQPVIGQRFIWGVDTGVIVGVVKDFHFRSMHEKIIPMVIHNLPHWRSTCYLEIPGGHIGQTLAGVEKEWKILFPALPFEYSFLNDDFDKLYRSDKKIALLMLLFAIITIFVASLGLFGLAAFTAERRVKEIGIRKVLGASVINIVQLLSTEFVTLVTISIIIATPIAWAVMKEWLNNYEYRISINPCVFIVAGMISVFIALITVSVQSIKAAIENPVKILRTE